MQRSILLVGESTGIRDNLAERLREAGHSVMVASTAEGAVNIARDVPIDAALIENSGEAGGEELRQRLLAERPRCRAMLLSNVAHVRRAGKLLNFGEPDYILSGLELIRAAFDSPSDGPDRSAEPRARSLVKVVDLLISLLEIDDAFFGGFSHQVAKLVRAVGEEMGLDDETLDELIVATLLRDIGKIGVKRELLDAEDPFTTGEMDQVRAHAVWSVRLLEHIDFGRKILPVVRHHHERYDGTGYPDGLRGRGIPLGARIIAVCESFAAMLSERPHRPARALDDAIDELMAKAGTQFDPEIVEVFMQVTEKNPTVGFLISKAPVLLIDPEPEFRRLLKVRLLNHGVNVRAVSHLDGDLRAYIGTRPALILVDAGDDGMRPFEVLQQLEALEFEQHVPVAVLARQDDRLVRLNALRHGVDDYILKTDDLEEAAVRVENILAREARRTRSGSARRAKGVSGLLENLTLPDIVQMLSLGSKTASVTLRSKGAEGRIWFRDGTIVHALCGEVAGETAFYELMTWRSGDFLINHGVVTNDHSIAQDAMYLLMEGVRRMDERSAESAAVPSAASPGLREAGWEIAYSSTEPERKPDPESGEVPLSRG